MKEEIKLPRTLSELFKQEDKEEILLQIRAEKAVKKKVLKKK